MLKIVTIDNTSILSSYVAILSLSFEYSIKRVESDAQGCIRNIKVLHHKAARRSTKCVTIEPDSANKHHTWNESPPRPVGSRGMKHKAQTALPSSFSRTL
jgi:hypothetical protein